MNQNLLTTEDLENCLEAAIELVDTHEKVDESICDDREKIPLEWVLSKKRQADLLDEAGEKHAFLDELMNDLRIEYCLQLVHKQDIVRCSGIIGQHWTDWLLNFSEQRLLKAEELYSQGKTFSALVPLDPATRDRITKDFSFALHDLLTAKKEPVPAKPEPDWSKMKAGKYKEISRFIWISEHPANRTPHCASIPMVEDQFGESKISESTINRTRTAFKETFKGHWSMDVSNEFICIENIQKNGE